MAAPENLYPLSTQRGEAIPLEIIKPKSMAKYAFAVNTAADITIPAGFKTCWVYATKACVLRQGATNLPNALVNGTEYPATTFIPAETPMSILLQEGEYSLLGLADAGDLYINHVTQWAALNQALQTSLG